jgi:hypothetical protein
MNEDFEAGSSAVKQLTDSILALISANKQAEEDAKNRAAADKKYREDKEKARKAEAEATKTKNESNAALQKITSTGKAVAKEFMSIADAGAKLSSTLGTSLTRGTQLELSNRMSLLGQLRNIEVDRMATMEQIVAAEKSFVDVFGAARKGMQLSAEGATQFASELKEAAGGNFTLTAAALQGMITAGISGAQGLDKFKKSTGLANISNERLAQLINKNSLSFMLYGPRFAKAAQEAEKLGISLASVQSAQESMVTNLDGTIDTVAQINQLGGQIDFGTLTRINEFEGPEATLKYLQSTIPPSLFQSASTRALLKGFGISVEDLMKRQGSVQDQAANTIEARLTELTEPVSTIAKNMATLGAIIEKLKNSFGPLLLAIGSFGVALFGIGKAFPALKGSALFSGFKKLTETGALNIAARTGMSTTGLMNTANFLKVGPLAGLISGITGFFSAKAAGADTKTAAATGATRGVATLLGAGVGAALLPFLGPLGPIIGGMLGDFFARFIPKSMIDSIANLFGSIGNSLKNWWNAVKEFTSGFIALVKAITSENSKLAPIFKAIGFVLGGIVGAVITIVGGLFNIFIKMSTALLKLGGGALKLLARFIGGEEAAPAAPATTIGNDVVSRSGYGDRTLVTPDGSVALNNRDTVVAFADDMINGVRTLSLGSIARNMQPTTDGALVAKVTELINVLQSAKTVISVDNKIQQVPRMAMAGVYTRNERV